MFAFPLSSVLSLLLEEKMKNYILIAAILITLPAILLGQPGNITWTQEVDALYPFCRAASAKLGDYVYVFGSSDTNQAQAFNIVSETWEESTLSPYGNCNWCGVSTNEHVYLIGRYENYVGYGYEFQRFTPSGGGPTGNWTLMADYPDSLCGAAADWDGGNYIYACGGGIAPTPTVNAYRYSISTDVWESIADLPIPMKYHGGAFINGKFHIVGGTSSANSHFVYNPATNEWETKADPPVSLLFPLFNTTSNGMMMFCINRVSSYTPTTVTLIYNPVLDSWQTLDGGPWSSEMDMRSAEYIGESRVLVAGGYAPLTGETYIGEEFPIGLSAPAVCPVLTPQNPPILIPGNGGTFQYFLGAGNYESITLSFDLWTMVTLPDGSNYGPVMLTSLTFTYGLIQSRFLEQMVPGRASPGIYTYHAYTGEYPDSAWNEESFEFIKLED